MAEVGELVPVSPAAVLLRSLSASTSWVKLVKFPSFPGDLAGQVVVLRVENLELAVMAARVPAGSRPESSFSKR